MHKGRQSAPHKAIREDKRSKTIYIQTVVMRGGEYKCRVLKVHLKSRDCQLKIITYRLLYKKLIVTTNQKSIIYTHKKEKIHKGKKKPIKTNPK